MPANLQMAAYGPAAFETLRESIRAAQAGDPLAPVTVAAPSNYAGLSLRRQLVRQGPLVNVRFLVLSRVAELLGAPGLAAAGKRPLAAWVRAEAIRAATAAHIEAMPHSIFAQAADHLATEQSLDATFRDLREAAGATLTRLEATGSRPAEVVALFRRYRAITADAYYDQSDLAVEAARAVAAGSTAMRDIGHVVLYLPRGLSEAEAGLIDALSAAGRASVILGLTGDVAADATARSIAARLAHGVTRPNLMPAVEPPAVSRIVAVTDSQEEVRTAARMAMERLKLGTPLHRMAVIYPVKETYAAAIHEHFSAAGIPHNGPTAGALAQSLAGRFLLALLRLPETNFRRDAVMDWLSAGPVIEQAGAHVPSGWWDTISREAGVVAGAGEWQQRLSVHRRALEARKLDQERPPSEGQIRRIDRALPQAGRLATFIEGLVRDLAPSGRTTWSEHAAWARRLLNRYMGDHAGYTGRLDERQKDAERDAYDQVLEQIANLEALDAVSSRAGIPRAVSAATFTRALEQLLQAPGPRLNSFGDGIFCGSLLDVGGMDFDAVFVLGMVEGLVPAIGQDDPLLPDDERRAFSSALPLRMARRADEARNYFAALAAGRERVLLLPAANLGGQQKYLPSRWLLAAATSLSGASKPLGTKDFQALEPSGWLTRIASFHEALSGTMEPGLAQEYDLRLLGKTRVPERHPLVTREPAIARGIAATRGRRERTLSRFDGLIGPRPELRPETASPTALQTWATCPFSYFLKHVLRVGEREDPEDILVLSAAERGNIIHEALDEFMTANSGWRQPWNSDHLAQLLDIADALCDRKESEGITGKPLLWHLERGRIRRDLEGFLEKDAARSGETGFYFLAGEHGFGDRAGAPPPVPVTLPDGSVIAFRGRIDRVDRNARDGRLAVYDYKTGSASMYKGMDADATKAGQLLQLPVYALAARQAFAEGDADVDANYWFVTRRGDYALHGRRVTGEELDRFRRQLQLIVDGIGGGLFPANPGKLDSRPGGSPSANCRYCPYDRLCQQDRRRAWERKQEDERGRAYLALAEANGGQDAGS